MKRKICALITSVLLILTCFQGVLCVSDESDAVLETDNLIDGIISYEMKAESETSVQEWLDGALAENAGTTSEWFVIALRQYMTGLDYTVYANALEKYAESESVSSAVTKQRIALALIACGRGDCEFVGSILDNTVGKQGIMSYVFGLHLLGCGATSQAVTADGAIGELLSLQLSDGGWAISGNISDVDVTAMTLQALAPYNNARDDVKSATDKAVALLSEKQSDDGGFKSYGTENPESAAQVIIALSSLGVDAAADPRFVKNGNTVLSAMLKYLRDDGSFCHTENGEPNFAATVQALMSLVAMRRAMSGDTSLFVFTGEVISDTPTSDAESKSEPELGYKLPVCLGIFAVALAVCAVLFIRGKRSAKNFVFVFLLSALAICAVLLTNIKTTESYYGSDDKGKQNVVGTVTLTLRCDEAVGKKISEYIPSDGVILPVTEFQISEGESVYDLLIDAAKKYSIQVDSSKTPLGAYVSGINYLYEFNCGELSGWIFRVNGITGSVSCGEYKLSDGDKVEWIYSCDS